ncbi:MAG TPA: tetratricopeptide repeat protein [Nakamurella sp.]|nr:tetratricopeptide repeat protein [Nakamurella sp.]
MNNLSNDLATVGRRDEALAVIQDAVEIRRRLFAANPAGYGSDLAQSLNNLSNRLAEAGRKKESDALGDIGRYLLEGSNVIGPRPLPANSIVSAGVQIVRGIYRGACR